MHPAAVCVYLVRLRAFYCLSKLGAFIVAYFIKTFVYYIADAISIGIYYGETRRFVVFRPFTFCSFG